VLEADVRRRRLHNLVDLARTTRGWTRAQLAEALGRDPTKVYPESANPKADYLIALASALEWPVGDVIEAVWNEEDPRAKLLDNGASSVDSIEHDRGQAAIYWPQWNKFHSAGNHREALTAARALFQGAKTDEYLAYATHLEAAALEGMGQYAKSAEVARRGLEYVHVSPRTRNALRAGLANAWYSMWELAPALGACEVVIAYYDKNPPEKRVDWKRRAFIRYVRGNVRRRLAAVEPDMAEEHYLRAIDDLAFAAKVYGELSAELEDHGLLGIANTCQGGILEADVELGQRGAHETIDHMLASATAALTAPKPPVGDWLESWGWWCIFGSNLALRHLQGAAAQQTVQKFLALGLEIAERLDHWAMRERIFTLQLALHRTLVGSTGLDIPFVLPGSQRRSVFGAIGRIPRFREPGWQILETAQFVETAEEVAR
jgi:tetratricopeptide (TPR) repeat protein